MARARSFVRRGPRRVTSWEGAQIDIADLTVSANQFNDVVTEASFETSPNPTIVRIRGQIGVLTDSSSSSGAFGVVFMGMIVVTAKARSPGGVGALPDPRADVGSDWIWFHQAIVGEQVANEVDNNDLSIERVIVDNKAMRKVGPNQVLVFIAGVITCEGTLVVNVCGGVRVLLKLS